MRRLVSLTPRPSSAYTKRTQDHLQAALAYKSLIDAGIVPPPECDDSPTLKALGIHRIPLPDDVQRELLGQAWADSPRRVAAEKGRRPPWRYTLARLLGPFLVRKQQ